MNKFHFTFNTLLVCAFFLVFTAVAQAQVSQSFASDRNNDGSVRQGTQFDQSERLNNLRQSLQALQTSLANADTEESIYVNSATGG